MPVPLPRGVLAATVLALSAPGALGLTPFPKPEANSAVENGRSAPFSGAWSVTLPTMEMGKRDADLAICALPVRIEPANDTHIFYLGPRETQADAAMELIAIEDGTAWEPIAGGPSFFAVWIDPDAFYLYDQVPRTEADWGRPYIYRRCP